MKYKSSFCVTRYAVLVSVIFFVGCKKEEGCTDSSATNFNETADVDNGSCTYDEAFTVPLTYNFVDENGNSTVSFTGQHQRLNMLSEMVQLMKSANTPGVEIFASDLLSMYANDGYIWEDAEGLGMTDSSKQLRNKTAGGDPAIQSVFEGYMEELAEASANSAVSGVVQSTTNPDKAYLQSAQGKEWTQLIEKGLMGAVFYYNISQVYLGASKMDVDNTEAVNSDADQFYTRMEHHWDEAYGYFTTATDYPVSGTNRFWGKYANARESLMGSSTIISTAFRTGRAAITAGDLEVRDAQIAIIRAELERVAAATSIHYLNVASGADFSDDALRNHALSEASAFLGSLPFGFETSVNFEMAIGVQAIIGDDFYAVSVSDLLQARDALAEITGLSDIADAL